MPASDLERFCGATHVMLPQSSKVSRAFESIRSLARGRRDYAQDLAVKYDSGLSTLAERRKWLLPAVIFGLIGTAIVWIIALVFPHAMATIYSYGFNSDLPSRYSRLLTVLLMSIPFAPPFLSAYALGNLFFPTSTKPEIAVGVMSTFEYRQESNKKWLIFIAAGLAGALNCLLLLIALTAATGN